MRRVFLSVAVPLALLFAGCAEARPTRPSDISMPEGFKIEAVVEDLDAPTMVAFDDQNRMLIAESGYGDGGDAQVTRVEPDGTKTVLAGDAAFGDEKPVTAVAFHDGRVYVAHAGKISTIADGGRLRDVVTGLPGRATTRPTRSSSMASSCTSASAPSPTLASWAPTTPCSAG